MEVFHFLRSLLWKRVSRWGLTICLKNEEKRERKHEYKSAKANSFLIVTEGERTEPLYFEGIQKKIKEKVGGIIDVIELPVIDIWGGLWYWKID